MASCIIFVDRGLKSLHDCHTVKKAFRERVDHLANVKMPPSRWDVR